MKDSSKIHKTKSDGVPKAQQTRSTAVARETDRSPTCAIKQLHRLIINLYARRRGFKKQYLRNFQAKSGYFWLFGGKS